jgi:bacteriorhodopsin
MSSFITESSNQSNTNNNNVILSQQPQPKSKEETVAHLVKASFMITYILLLTTATITFIEALRTENPLIRHIFNLETCISLVASYFYSVFVAQLDTFEKEKKMIDWETMTKTRYIDWAITTPLMLLVLCAFLANESKTILHFTTIGIVVVLNYIMLYLGYLGETGVMDRTTACIGGFVPFAGLFYLIYKSFIVTGEGFNKYFLFPLYLVFWTGYGLVYLLEESYKNIAMNILDCISKCLIGIALWIYYTNIIPAL